MQNRGERRTSSSNYPPDALPSRPARRRVSRTRERKTETQDVRSHRSIVPPSPNCSANEEKKTISADTSDEDDEKTYISIGIDLGTTFSGVAWALSTSPKDISIISSWPAHLPANSCQHKVPSVLTYDKGGNVASWGYKLDSTKHYIEWFKLGLSKEATRKIAADQPEKYERLQAILRHKQKSAVDVVADFLRCLWTHATKEIQRSVVRGVWDNVDLKIVLTVPAIWDHDAQHLTRSAAEMAGLLERSNTTLELIGEPEAAALSVFDEMKRERQRRKLREEETFVVCDAGGGTVDLISYAIEDLRPLKLCMSTESTGDFCGATFVDGSFLRHIRTMMSVEDFSKLDERQQRKMTNDWECAKRQFRLDSPEDERWYIDVPGYLGKEIQTPNGAEDNLPAGFSPSQISLRTPLDEVLRISSPSALSLRTDPGAIVLETHHMHAIFNESCSKIKSLVADQVLAITKREGKRPTAILLVGGYGENVFLKQALECEFPDIEIQQPLKAWAAICRGAVMKGLGTDVVVNHISVQLRNYRYTGLQSSNTSRDRSRD
ncbi:hypothetical protein VTL71DRAFT_9680 [Oculimacula yallundae]|uniref:Uncharacterized protein n=1 Tax=Oculimacula yallundae TaxID=86028 RepID=A0ABR4BRQ0_9HELO